MSAKKTSLPQGWKLAKLSEVMDIDTSVFSPRPAAQYRLVGLEHIAQGTGVITDAPLTDGSQIHSTKLVFGPNHVLYGKLRPNLNKVAMPDFAGICSTDILPLATKHSLMREYLAFYLRTPRFVEWATTNASGTKMPRIGVNQLREARIPVPPLPVQECIVEILCRADDIRRKRLEALALVDAVLAAAFTEMFGDPSANSKAFSKLALGDLADVRAGVTKGRDFNGQETVEVPYLRVANVQDGFLDLTEIKTIEVLPGDIDKYHLEDGDILMTEGGDPDKLGRGCVWRNQIEGCIHQNHVFRVRTNRGKLTPEYLAALLRTPYAKHYFLGCAKRSSNLASINSTQVKAFEVPLPPVPLQNKFVAAVEQWNQATARLNSALHEAENVLRSLTAHAFAGELTCEWERENAPQIAQQQALSERLPQLLLLATLTERAKRAAGPLKDAVVLVTALMKYVFLVQMEGASHRRLYRFVPYHYGPFAKELYADLEALQEQGLIAVTNGDDDKTEIRLADDHKATQEAALLPDDLREDVCAVLDAYGQLDHKNLLKSVYDKYPAYAVKSKLRKRRARRGQQGA